MSAVGFQFCLAGTSGADTAAEPRKRRTDAGQSCQPIAVLRKRNLYLSLSSARPACKDIQNQHGAVYYLAVSQIRDIAQLHTGQLGIKNQHFNPERFCQRGNLLQFARSDTGCGLRCRTRLNNRTDDLASGCFGKLGKLFYGLLRIVSSGINTDQNNFCAGGLLNILMHASNSCRRFHLHTAPPCNPECRSQGGTKTVNYAIPAVMIAIA